MSYNQNGPFFQNLDFHIYMWFYKFTEYFYKKKIDKKRDFFSKRSGAAPCFYILEFNHENKIFNLKIQN